MRQGVVRRAVWSTRRIEGMPGGALLEVESDNGEMYVALDRLGVGVGETVLVTCGTAAVSLVGKEAGMDAVIVAILDN